MASYRPTLRERLNNYPFLQFLVTDYWIVVAASLNLAAVIFAGLSFLKIWTVSPPDTQPPIKISGVDFVQAWSLARTARKFESEGRREDAAHAWLASVANHPGHSGHVRSALENFLALPRKPEMAGTVLQHAFWLLKLTATNAADLDLSARLLAKEMRYDALKALLESAPRPLPANLEILHLKSLFELGDPEAFEARWSAAPASIRENPEAGLYHDAMLAGWTKGDAALGALERLDAAAENPALQAQALRLALAVSLRLNSLPRYEKALSRLQASQTEEYQDRLRYWKLLAASGERGKAASLIASSTSLAPANAIEAVETAQILFSGGQKDAGLKWMREWAVTLGGATEFWTGYAILLLRAEEWRELQQLALQMRQSAELSRRFLAYSFYLEGRALLAQESEADAKKAFQKATETPFTLPRLGFQSALELHQINENKTARDILTGLKTELEDEPRFWPLLYKTAETIKDEPLMLEASAKAYEKMPESREAIQRYVTSLLLNQTNLDEAMRLSLASLPGNRASISARLNHCQALILNQRYAEAEKLLAALKTQQMPPADLTRYYFLLSQVFTTLNRPADAAAARQKIRPELLFPSEQRRLDAMTAQASAPPANG